MPHPKKSLGQHWLKDRGILNEIVDAAKLSKSDTVLEIGPGLGTLTSVLLSRARQVVAVEYDSNLAEKLPGQFPGKNLEVVSDDFLRFDLNALPAGYKVVANLPYYITQKVIERLLLSDNQPESMALLVQREVAEKLAAEAGGLTAIAVKLQLAYCVQLSTRVPKEYFSPPPKVESQVIVCKKRHVDKDAYTNRKDLFKIINAGFSAPRKKLRSSVSAGLAISKTEAEQLLEKANINPGQRAEDLLADDWRRLQQVWSQR